MLHQIHLPSLLFVDIETVPQYGAFHELSPAMQELWAAKHSNLHIADETAEDGYLKRAGVYAEFAKVVCISIGFFHYDRAADKRGFRIKSFYGDDERQILLDFVELMNKRFNDSDAYSFCGHNIREFDVPFLCRRLLIHAIPFPELLDISGKRPWETPHIDTMQLWKFGDYKSFTSLKLLAEVLGIPTPKDVIDGKDVCRVYWQEKGLPTIVEYCQKDVITVARLLLRFKGDTALLNDSDVIVAI